ncbi:MAG: hypothetical protein UX16_C0001G0013 [Parcubacteria group bacterium GW2011_GWB1_45_7]|uniref:Uncharacterized protein n=4 Tax=Parcubacteria group TaxID=1794811 RepID=A0A0H4TC78_9BACT|nr:hypothetical protein [uncultured Parcubacteria bacterium Rifle_16ft_4_minimus_37647]AKQ05611.1 hypothetical protein [uncultured Parcubacteria bacterium Rifle_16ft_4_minimus_23790]KKU11917.1 MAG: hypothetical protein UX16_C0001G0013 [Parcubacteria group bacterium GW2011_GWB1_45_7]OGY58626.1 MAG: hypothetical protein A3C03_02550 [Candidatus Colwellbacteria bacterium RIFCSPHIGHO2_02_FULL_45_17]OGY61721.1 MAG: hypothetical protein A3I33_03015 [Candidatus Colwellbacteria bacterium RIFCSPLOWO2_02_
MLQFIVSVILVTVASFLQTTAAIIIKGGIKPNLIIVLLVVLACVNKGWTTRVGLILLSAFILKFSPWISWADVIFISTALLAMALVDYLPWRRGINSIIAVAAGTVILNPSFSDISSIVLEVIINTSLILIFLLVLEILYGKKKKPKENRL